MKLNPFVKAGIGLTFARFQRRVGEECLQRQ